MTRKPYTTHINAKGFEIEVRYGGTQGDFFSLSDMARFRNPDNAGFIIQNWMRNRNVIRYLGLWEQMHNPQFQPTPSRMAISLLDCLRREGGKGAKRLNYLEFEAIEKKTSSSASCRRNNLAQQ